MTPLESEEDLATKLLSIHRHHLKLSKSSIACLQIFHCGPIPLKAAQSVAFHGSIIFHYPSLALGSAYINRLFPQIFLSPSHPLPLAYSSLFCTSRLSVFACPLYNFSPPFLLRLHLPSSLLFASFSSPSLPTLFFILCLLSFSLFACPLLRSLPPSPHRLYLPSFSFFASFSSPSLSALFFSLCPLSSYSLLCTSRSSVFVCPILLSLPPPPPPPPLFLLLLCLPLRLPIHACAYLPPAYRHRPHGPHSLPYTQISLIYLGPSSS